MVNCNNTTRFCSASPRGVRIPVAYHNKKRKDTSMGIFSLLAESKGFEGLRPSRSLCSLTRFCSASPRGFESLLLITIKKKRYHDRYLFPFGGEQGIRTLETVLAVYTISSRAPSTSSDNSPYSQINKYISRFFKAPCYYT